jgi:NAD(P)-dependent dehydrogenase (short-subunit alcohol dehydrogenase family)
MTVAFAKELAPLGFKVNASCPGYTATDLHHHTGSRTPEQGAAIGIRLATLPDDGPTGGFFDDEGIVAWRRQSDAARLFESLNRRLLLWPVQVWVTATTSRLQQGGRAAIELWCCRARSHAGSDIAGHIVAEAVLVDQLKMLSCPSA